jgi:alpha-glucoside transport system permease protein
MVTGKKRSKTVTNLILLFICALWTLPTFGLFISSFRDRFDIQTSGWWSILPHREYVETGRFDDVPRDFDNDVPFAIPAIASTEAYTFDEWRAGVEIDGVQYRWVGNKRIGGLEIQERQWVTNANFTLENYQTVLSGKSLTVLSASGEEVTVQGANLSNSFLNSLAVTIPATVIPILIAAFAAYGFAWMRFPLRKVFFVMIIALLVVPLQVALVPVLRAYSVLGLNGTYLGLWLAHTGFGLPLATYLLYNYISQLPRETLESAFIDGASHFTVFTRLILPLSVPALASFAIFQFLWVWNDYLVALVFLLGTPNSGVLTMQLQEIVGSRGDDWHLLTSGAFITMLLPLIVFFSLQRYFVRGLLAGSVKG